MCSCLNRRVLCLALILPLAAVAADPDSAETADSAGQQDITLPETLTDSPLLNARFLLFGNSRQRSQTLRWAAKRGDKDMVPALIYALRYSGERDQAEIADTLRRLTGRRYGSDWFRWKQYQQANPEIKPFPHFAVFLGGLLRAIDPGFGDFVHADVKHDIRLEEIVWGGVRSKDGIPALDHPKLIAAADAGYLSPDERVFGIQINGDTRAYPYRIMDWHEMLNDTIGGQPVSLAYCTLCGSGILFNTTVAGEAQPLTFGSSGLLYRSNKLMYDRATESLWNQFTGRPVVGPLTGSGTQLQTLPLVSTTWGEWRSRHPETRVLSLQTGFTRDYRPGKPYGTYFSSPDLMFPTLTNSRELRQKQQVFGLRLSGANRAWPLQTFRGGKVLNDQVGVIKVVLIGNAASRNIRAYRRGDQIFGPGGDPHTVISDAGTWQVTEAALLGPNREQLTRLPGHLAYWFAWYNYFGSDTLSTAKP